MHQYLVTEVVLWKRQEAYEKIKSNGITSESMEISVTDGLMCDDYYRIDDFYFTAFCLLGTAEPCFESAALLTFSRDAFQEQLNEMVSEFKLAFGIDSKLDETMKKEGDEKAMAKLDELLAKFNVSMEDLTFDVEGLNDEELETRFEEVFNAQEDDVDPTQEEFEVDETEPVEPEEPIEEPTEEDFALEGESQILMSSLISSLRETIWNKESVTDEWGTYARYYYVDLCVDTNEVFFEDSKDWKLYGTTYEVNGDEVTVDFENVKRKKYAIVDYVESLEDYSFSVKDIVENIVNTMSRNFSEKYGEIEGKYNAMLTEQNNSAIDTLISQFEAKLQDEPEFRAIVTKKYEYKAAELETILYAMLGKKQFSLIDKPQQRTPKAPVIHEEDDKKDTGRYGNYLI